MYLMNLVQRVSGGDASASAGGLLAPAGAGPSEGPSPPPPPCAGSAAARLGVGSEAIVFRRGVRVFGRGRRGPPVIRWRRGLLLSQLRGQVNAVNGCGGG